MNLNETTDLSVTTPDFFTSDKIAEHTGTSLESKNPEYICPVHGEIKNKTMELKADDVELALCCIYCLADLINKSTPKIKQIE